MCLLLACTSAFADDADSHARLWSGRWSLNSWGLHSQGSFCLVISGPNLRLEVLEVPTNFGLRDYVSPLWDQQGKGWTIITATDGPGTANQWGYEWHPLGIFMRNLIVQCAAEIPALIPSDDSVSRSREDGVGESQLSSRRSIVVSSSGKEATMRSKLITRGMGQGGPGETIVMARVPRTSSLNSAGHALEIRSSRRPGSISLNFRTCGLSLPDVPLELFAPLWPLSDFLNISLVNTELQIPASVEN